MKTKDSKYFYCAELMNQALLALLEKKDIDFISVTEITKKAGVSRSTFYLHYDSIEDLFFETVEKINKKFLESFDVKVPLVINSKEEAFLITDAQLVPYLNFVKDNKRILKLIHQKPALFQTQKAYKQMYDKIFYPAISRFLSKENEKIYNLEFFIGGVSAIIHKWLDMDCETEIEELIRIIKNCINYTLA